MDFVKIKRIVVVFFFLSVKRKEWYARKVGWIDGVVKERSRTKRFVLLIRTYIHTYTHVFLC